MTVIEKTRKFIRNSIVFLIQVGFFFFVIAYLILISIWRFFKKIKNSILRKNNQNFKQKQYSINPLKNIHSDVFKERIKSVQMEGFKIKEYYFKTKDNTYVSLWRIISDNQLEKSYDDQKRQSLRQNKQNYKDKNNNKFQQPILIMHGLLDYSYSWFAHRDKNKTLPYMLAKEGYDVWVGNNRGTRACLPDLNKIKDSKDKNKEVNKLNQNYWEYTFDHLVQYDVSTLIEGVLQQTNCQQLYYIGHSQGGCQLLTALGIKPQLKKKLKRFVGLGTLVGVSNLTDHGAVNFLSQYRILPLIKFLGFKSLYIIPNWMSIMIGCLVHNFQLAQQMAQNGVMALCGQVSERKIDVESLAILSCHQPGGSSINNVQHWVQCVQKGKIRKFDYGMVRNLKIYGQHEPPAYSFDHLKQIDFECHFFLGTKDKMITEKDFQILLGKMNPNLTKEYYVKDYGHLDYLWSKRAHQDIYKNVVKIIKNDISSSQKSQKQQNIIEQQK